MSTKYLGPAPIALKLSKEAENWLERVYKGLFTKIKAKRIYFDELSSNPDDPDNETAVFWLINDQIHVKITDSSGTTSTYAITDGDQLDIDWTPSNYTRTTSPSEVTSLEHLTAHLAGIDNAFDVYKELQINPGAAKAPPVKAASYVSYGLDGAWEFSDGTDDTVVLSINMPKDMDLNYIPDFLIFWASPTTGGDVVWQIEYKYIGIDEDVTSAVDDTISATDTSSTTADGLVKTPLTASASPAADDKILSMRIKRLGADGNDTLSDDANLLNIALKYRSTSRGEAT